MKKMIAVLLLLCMLPVLSACGGQDVKGSVSQITETPAAAEPAPAEPAAEPTPAEPAAEEPAAPETEEELQIGSVSGGRYENAYFGFGCELGESWSIADEETLAGMIGLTAEAIGGDYAEEILKADMFYDLYAESAEEMASVNIVIQKIGTAALFSEEQIIDASLDSAKAQMEAAGFSDITMEKNSLTFAGSEHLGVKISAVVQGVQIYEQQVYFKKGEHMAIITVASYLTDRAADYCELFYTVS